MGNSTKVALTALFGLLFATVCSVAGSIYPDADGVQDSFITGEPIGEIAVAERLDIELHADFMASRSFGSETVLNWFNLGYSGGGEFNDVGGTFGDFGLQFPYYERDERYPGWAETADAPAVVFDGNNTMKADFPVEDGVSGHGTATIELWVLNEYPDDDEVILGWESEDGEESSAPLYWPEELSGSAQLHHIVVNLEEEEEVWYIDGEQVRSREREMVIEDGHIMVLGGSSMDSPSFTGHLVTLRVHNDIMTEDQVEHNFEGGVMLGTDLHINVDPNVEGTGNFEEAWGAPDPEEKEFYEFTNDYFRQRVHHSQYYEEWDESEREEYLERVECMMTLSEANYYNMSRRMARRVPIVSIYPRYRGDGIKYKTPIQAARGDFMGWNDDLGFGYGCQWYGFFNSHEYVHGTQGQMGGGLAGHYWEIDANFPQTYLGVYQTNSVTSDTSAFYEAHGRDYYHNRNMFEHLAQSPEYGPMFISKLWYEGEHGQSYPWILFDKYNPDPSTSIAYEYGRVAQRNVTWDYEIFPLKVEAFGFRETSPDRYWNDFSNRKAHNIRASHVVLEEITDNPGWYRPVKQSAPQQEGWNIVPLQANSQEVSVTLSGYINPERGSNWRAGFVAVDDERNPRYSDLIEAGETLQFETEDDEELYLAVAGAPDEFMSIGLVQDVHTLEAEQLVYKLQLEGADPANTLWDYYDAEYSMEDVSGVPHPNGGGFVADTAEVEESVYVASDARILGDSRVSGNARVENMAIIHDSTVEDEAIVSGKSLVTNRSTVRDNAIVSGQAIVYRSTVHGYARIRDRGRARQSDVGDFAKVTELGTVERQDVGGRAVIKGQAHSFDGDISGTPMVDGSYHKGNNLDKGKWFHWSWGTGQETGEYDKDFHGLYLDMPFDRNHAWKAWDEFGITWGYRANDAASVQDEERGKVLELNGENQFIDLPGSVVDQIDMSLQIWVKWDGGDANQPVFDFGLSENDNIHLTPANDDGHAELVFNQTGNAETITAEASLPEGEWSKVVLSIDHEQGARLYIDDDLIGENEAITLLPLLRQGNDFSNYLGRSQDGESHFSGRLDQFKVATVSLPEGESWIPDPEELEEN